jgi:hypothetical protein
MTSKNRQTTSVTPSEEYESTDRYEETQCSDSEYLSNRIFSSAIDDPLPNNSNDDDTCEMAGPHLSQISSRHLFLDQTLFFLAGLGSSVGYISSLSSLVFFQQLFGNNFFVVLNLAVYLPLVPISVAQAMLDQKYDLYFETQRTFVVRAITGYGLAAFGTIQLAVIIARASNHHAHPMWVVTGAFLQGLGGAILYGQLNQLASFVTTVGLDENLDAVESDGGRTVTHNRSFKAAVSAGVQASAFVVLLLSYASGFGTMNGDRFPFFLWMILIVMVFCFLCVLWLLLLRPRVRDSMIHRDSTMGWLPETQTPLSLSIYDNPENNNQISPLEQPLLLTTQGERSNSLRVVSSNLLSTNSSTGQPELLALGRTQSQATAPSEYDYNVNISTSELPFISIWKYSQRCCFVLAMTLIPSFLIGSWFTRIRTQWMELPQILFYVRIGMDLVGRLATVLPTCEVTRSNEARHVATSDRDAMTWLVWIALSRWIFVILFFVNSSLDIRVLETYQDTLSITLVAAISFLSGYLVTTCYQLAPGELPFTNRTFNVTKQASVLTVAFAFSALSGLLSSFVLIGIGI